jgi:hypothetical protein
MDPRPPGPDRRLDRAAGAASLLAAAGHGLAAPLHAQEWWAHALFFLAAAVLQAVWGLALLTDAINPRDAGPSWVPLRRAFLAAGIVGNLASIGLYAVSRTVGVGVGPEPGPEALDALGLATKAAEAATVALLAALLARLRGSAPKRT